MRRLSTLPNVLRPRLEEHYFSNILEDLLVLTYKHEEHESKPVEWKDSMKETYSFPFHQIPTNLYEDHITTNLISNQTSKLGVDKVKEAPNIKWFNPIDYTIVPKKKIVKPFIPKPWSPTVEGLPHLEKINLKIFTNAAINNRMVLVPAFMSLQSITGVMPSTVFADFSDAKQRIREGMPMGAQVDLYGPTMYEFMDKLIQLVLPKLRDFTELNPVAVDGKFTLKLPASAMGYFPDIEPVFDKYPRLFDTDITFTTNGSEEDTILLLSAFQLPFRKEKLVVETKVKDDDPWAKYKRRKK